MKPMKTECITIPKAEYEKLLVLARSVPALIAENEQLKAENRLMRDKIDMLIRRVFGTSSEKFDPNQMMLDLSDNFKLALEEPEDDSDESGQGKRKRRKRTPKKDRLPDDLPEERVVVNPPEVDANPDAYLHIGTEETVKLDVKPLRFKKIVTERRKYVLKDHSSAPVIAPALKQLINGSFASASLLARIAVNKFVDHLPLYRQEQIFARHGITLSRKTMTDIRAIGVITKAGPMTRNW